MSVFSENWVNYGFGKCERVLYFALLDGEKEKMGSTTTTLSSNHTICLLFIVQTHIIHMLCFLSSHEWIFSSKCHRMVDILHW